MKESVSLVTLIATVHRGRGAANSMELLRIIESIKPDVIFEEISPQNFPSYYGENRYQTLETVAISRYVDRHHVPHVPVDLDASLTLDFKHKIKNVFTLFDRNLEYSRLGEQRDLLVQEFGFPYLNSHECQRLMVRMCALEDDMISVLNDEVLVNTYKLWRTLLDEREQEMIRNIYAYNESSPFESGLFLVGSEHREPIMAKLRHLSINSNRPLQWNFSYFDQLM